MTKLHYKKKKIEPHMVKILVERLGNLPTHIVANELNISKTDLYNYLANYKINYSFDRDLFYQEQARKAIDIDDTTDLYINAICDIFKLSIPRFKNEIKLERKRIKEKESEKLALSLVDKIIFETEKHIKLSKKNISLSQILIYLAHKDFKDPEYFNQYRIPTDYIECDLIQMNMADYPKEIHVKRNYLRDARKVISIISRDNEVHFPTIIKETRFNAAYINWLNSDYRVLDTYVNKVVTPKHLFNNEDIPKVLDAMLEFSSVPVEELTPLRINRIRDIISKLTV